MNMSTARQKISTEMHWGKTFDQGTQWTGVGKVGVAKFGYLMKATDQPNSGYVLKAPHRSYKCVRTDEEVFDYIAQIEEASAASGSDSKESSVVQLTSVTLPQITGLALLTLTVLTVLVAAFLDRKEIFKLLMNSQDGAILLYSAFTLIFGVLAGLATGKFVDPIGLLRAIGENVFARFGNSGS
ncbi:MAG: hypothetical protein AAF641_14790 [Pseudomonadota bacterium]